MSFDHLDDPQPPPRPSDLVVARIMAEGGRRLRHRRYVGTGAAVLAMVVGAVGLTSRLSSDDSDKILTATPDSTTPTSSTPSTTAVAGAGSAADQFAAIIQPNDSALQVGMADARTGQFRMLAEFPLVSDPWPCCVALSPDRSTVYYVRPAGDYDGDDHDNVDTIWAVPADGSGDPEYVADGFEPEVSPDGLSLAYVRPATSELEELVLRDLGSGEERKFETPAGKNIQSIAWAGNGSISVSWAGLGGEQESVHLLSLDGSEVDLGQAREYGPAADAPQGTWWRVHDNSAPPGTLSIVEESSGDITFFTINGELQQADETTLPGHVLDASTDPSNTRQLFLTSTTDPPDLTTLYLRAGPTALTPVPLDAITIIAIDW